MRADQRAAIWEEVWAEYDARQARRVDVAEVSPAFQAAGAEQPSPVLVLAGGPMAEEALPVGPAPERVVPDWIAPEPARLPGPPSARPWEAERLLKAVPRRPRVRPVLQVVLSALAGLMLVAAWFTLPWLLAVRLSVPIGQGDAPALLRQFDGPAAMASLRAGLVAQVPADESEGARRFLTGMADRMAASWEKPEGIRSWLALRARGTRREGAAVSLSTLRSARAVGLATFRLEYGPAREEGGVAFDVAWQGDGFRVTGLRFLDTPPMPVAGPILAMR